MVDNSNSYKDRVSRLISWGHWFMLANILLAMVVALRYVFAVDSDLSFTAVIYLIASWIGHFGLLGIIAYIIILFPLTFVFPSSTAMRALGAFIATGAIVTLLIDGSVFGNYQLHLNLLAFDLEGFSLNKSIGWASISLFILAILSIELTIANMIWKRLSIIREWDVGNKITLFFGIAFLAGHLIHIWADAVNYRPVLAYDKIFPLSHQSTARGLLKKYGLLDEKERSEFVHSSAPRTIKYPINPLQCNLPTAQNLLFISIARINQTHLTPELMPNLYRFAQDNIQALNHITTSLNAQDIEFTIKTGLPANYRNIFEQEKLASPLISLTNERVRKRFGASDTERLTPSYNAAAFDQSNLNQLTQWISEHNGKPYIADLTLFSSQDLSVPDGFTSSYNHPDQQMRPADRLLATQYFKAITYTDTLLGHLLSTLDLSNTTVVITGNRGNDLHAIYQQSEAYSAVNLRVPLVVAMPNTPPQIITKQTSHYDILPTLLRHHFRCGNPESDSSIGYDLLSTQSSPLLYIGAAKDFALYQNNGIAQIDRQGNFRFFTSDYQPNKDGKLAFQQLIELKANINRFK